jgi:hypothetical protein
VSGAGAVAAAWPWALACVAVALLAAAVGYTVGSRAGAAPGPGGVPPPLAPGRLDVRALVQNLIAAHDLAAGAGAVRAQLERALHAAGVHRIPVAGGAVFDPNRHHAVGTEPTVDVRADRCVAREIRAGWQMGDRVVRPAEVIVWKQ